MYRLHALEDHSFTTHYKTVQQTLDEYEIQSSMPLEDYIGQNVDAMRVYVDDPHPSRMSHLIMAKNLHCEFGKSWSEYTQTQTWLHE